MQRRRGLGEKGEEGAEVGGGQREEEGERRRDQGRKEETQRQMGGSKNLGRRLELKEPEGRPW